MRILILSVDFPPHCDGVSTVSHHYARRLAELGHDVHALGPAAAGDAEFDATVPFGVTRFRGYDLGVLRFFPFVLQALRAIRHHRPDVIFAMNIGYGGVLCRFMKVPYVTMAYAYEFLKFAGTPLHRLYLSIYERSRMTIAITRFTADQLAAFGVHGDSIKIVNPGVAVAPIAPSAITNDATHPFRLGTCGRVIRRKGHDTVLRALPAIIEKVPDVEYVVAGDGPNRVALDALAAELGVESHVTFLGRVSDAELAAFYASLDLFVMPSRHDEATGHVEGFGIVYLEAALQGVPSIGSRTGGVPEAILDGETGLLVPPESPDALAEAVTSLARDSGRRIALGEAAQERVRNEFNWDRLVEQVEGLL
jgi:phosphatidylinositol alpha-1,6-mannosyltransferase